MATRVQTWRRWCGTLGSGVEARVSAGVDRGCWLGRHVQGAFGGFARSNEFGQNQWFEVVHVDVWLPKRDVSVDSGYWDPITSLRKNLVPYGWWPIADFPQMAVASFGQ